MSDADAPAGHAGHHATVPRERRTNRARESLPEASLAEQLAGDAVAALAAALPGPRRLWSAGTWALVHDVLTDAFRRRLRCMTII